MNNKQIATNAPKDATGIKIFDGFYRWRINGVELSKIYDCEDFNDVLQVERSLDDINEIIELKQEQAIAYEEATSLATALFNKYYKHESPNFELLDTTQGVISQIDNMSTGLTKVHSPNPDDQKLLDNKPLEATHVSYNGLYYFKVTTSKSYMVWHNDQWITATPHISLRSLDDIEKIIQLETQANEMQDNQAVTIAIAEERAVDEYCFQWRLSRNIDFTHFSAQYLEDLDNNIERLKLTSK
jgi:hypothetical protein